MQHHNYSLKSLNSFALAANAQNILFIDELAQLVELSNDLPEQFYILGGGSNSLFVDDYAGTVICPEFKGINVSSDADNYLLEVASSENWHELVAFCLKHKMPGLENLALIPGNCGAAPIQNIGAYGVEFADVCAYVKWFDFATQQVETLTAEQCQFSYRNSIFKGEHKNRGVVVAVGLCLSKNWQPVLKYAGLNELGDSPTPKQVFDTVIAIRQSKLPDPEVLPNAGSFFKNPVVSQQVFAAIAKNNPNMPAYHLPNGEVKLAAGWLIQECGLKGKQIGGAAVHKLQALVLVNIDNAEGRDVVQLAKYVQGQVLGKFNVMLEAEVRIIGKQGEIKLEDIQ
ncbi:UDP-N-acetylmuramate dehydrogenase [Colwelliaceae bacterium BS250]